MNTDDSATKPQHGVKYEIMFSLCPSGRTPIEFTWSGGSDCALDPAHRRIFQRGFLEVAESIRDHLVAAVHTLVDTVSREQTSETCSSPRTSTTDRAAGELIQNVGEDLQQEVDVASLGEGGPVG